jgi:sortase A
VALLRIPAIDFEAYVLEGSDRSVLAKGPGHISSTPLPGEPGNSAIAGHRTMYGHPFHDLHLLQPGDEIFAATAECATVYRVARVAVVYPSELGIIAQTGADRLTLMTCHPEGSSARRLVVVAEPTG